MYQLFIYCCNVVFSGSSASGPILCSVMYFVSLPSIKVKVASEFYVYVIAVFDILSLPTCTYFGFGDLPVFTCKSAACNNE